MLLSSNIYAADKKNYVDKAHQDLVKSLEAGAEKLPEGIQQYTTPAIEDIRTDAKNFQISFEYNRLNVVNSDVGAINGEQYRFDGGGTQYDIGTIGLRLMPNTWQINISVSGIFNTDQEDPGAQVMRPDQMRHDEGYDELSHFDIFMKPVKSKYGNIGIGLYKCRSYQMMQANWQDNLNEGVAHLVDIKNDGKNLVSANNDLVLNDKEFYGYNSEINRFSIMYTLPDMRFIPNGIGVQYTYELSDLALVLSADEMAIHPDIEAHSVGFGLYKTLDEINDGFSIPSVSVITTSYNAEYYNFRTSQNETSDGERLSYMLKLMYMKTFNKQKNRKIFCSLSAELTDWDDGMTEQEELKLGVGLSY